ncbi:MAG: hypothetical protein Kow00124_29230 [Anaerolineae bacterium]
MASWLNIGLQAALVTMVVLLAITTYRIWAGPSAADRLQATETTTTLLIGVIILLALLQRSSLLVDVGIALAAFSFVGTLVVARYLAEGRVF